MANIHTFVTAIECPLPLAQFLPKSPQRGSPLDGISGGKVGVLWVQISRPALAVKRLGG